MKRLALTLFGVTSLLISTAQAGEPCVNPDGSLTPKCDQIVKSTCTLPNGTFITACKNQFLSKCVNKDNTLIASCKAAPKPSSTSGTTSKDKSGKNSYSYDSQVYFEVDVGDKIN